MFLYVTAATCIPSSLLVKYPFWSNRSMIRSVNSLIGVVKAPHPLNLRLTTDDDASIRKMTSAS